MTVAEVVLCRKVGCREPADWVVIVIDRADRTPLVLQPCCTGHAAEEKERLGRDGLARVLPI